MMESCCVMRRLPGDAQVCSSKQASAAQSSSTRRSLLLLLFLLLLNLHVSFPRFPFHFLFLFLGASVPPLLPFLSTVKAKGGLDTSGRQACGRPGAGDLSMSGRQTAAGVWGRVEADEALLKDSVGLEKKEGTEERAGAVVGRGLGVGWSKAVSQADGQCWRAQEETLNVWWFW